jgi:hypothetical protein
LNSTTIASTKFALSVLRCLFGRHVQKFCVARRIALFAIAAFTVGSIGGPAVAQEGFALIGVWEHTERATQNSPGFSITWSMNPDGTCFWQGVVAGAGGGSGRMQARCRYRATGSSSFVFQVQAYQSCGSSGTCSSCPPAPGEVFGGGCSEAEQFGLAVGVQQQRSYRMQGPNQFVDEGGQMWLRVR